MQGKVKATPRLCMRKCHLNFADVKGGIQGNRVGGDN